MDDTPGKPNSVPTDTRVVVNAPAYRMDVSRSQSGDKTVLALRHEKVITELRRSTETEVMSVTGQVAGILRRWGGRAVVDVIGIGAGVVDRLRELKLSVSAFNASERSEATDKSGELQFLNMRAAAWWQLRELLDPANNENIALPPDDELIGDLTAPHWKVTSAGRIQIESKDEIRKRLGRSTDTGDPVVMAFHEEAEEPGLEDLDEDIASAIRNYRGGREDYDPPYGPWARR